MADTNSLPNESLRQLVVAEMRRRYPYWSERSLQAFGKGYAKRNRSKWLTLRRKMKAAARAAQERAMDDEAQQREARIIALQKSKGGRGRRYGSEKYRTVDPRSVNWQDYLGRTRLHLAVLAGDLAQVRHLVEVEGAELFWRDNGWHTPAQLAYREQQWVIWDYLVSLTGAESDDAAE